MSSAQSLLLCLIFRLLSKDEPNLVGCVLAIRVPHATQRFETHKFHLRAHVLAPDDKALALQQPNQHAHAN